MNIDQKQLFLSKIQEYFKNKRDIDLTQKKLEWYWQTLCDYEMEDISIALRFHDRDPKRGGFPPKPADIISKIERSPARENSKCQFSKKGIFESQCKSDGEINYGRDGFRPSPCPENWEGDIFFDEFEKVFWSDRKIICQEHFEFIFSRKWENENKAREEVIY